MAKFEYGPGFRQVYGNRTRWTFPPDAPENLGRTIPHDAEVGPNRGDLEVVAQDGATRWVVVR